MILHSLIATAFLSLPTAGTEASAPPTAEPLSPNQYMEYSDPKNWLVEMTARVFPDGRLPGHHKFPGWTYSDFALILPYTQSTSTSWMTQTNEETVVAGLLINGIVANTEDIPTRTVPGTAATYASLELDAPVTFISAVGYIQSRITCVETEFNEKAAWDVPWPTGATPLAAWLAPDPTYDVITPGQPDHVQLLVDKWTDGNDPKQIPPVQLAKYLTANVLEHTRTTGSNTQSPLGGSGYRVPTTNSDQQDVPRSAIIVINSRGGFNVQNASETARTKKGSEHDLANLLTAVFRRAGLPARTVIGVDNDERGDDLIKSWVEFAIFPADMKRPLWIPVDVWELEDDGRSTRNWKQPWKHFGTSDLLREVPPIAYYFHPPANYRSYHLPGLFGIRSDTELPDFGTQSIHFEVNGAPNRGGQQRRP